MAITPCLYVADYSAVTAQPRLPFIFLLDESLSVLEPAPGESQRFVYFVAGAGDGTATDADMSYFLLNVCEDLTLEDIASVLVFINNVPQQVVLGDNVRIQRTSDDITGCTGLLFRFPLTSVDGEMSVDITLRRTFDVGPTAVCVAGGSTGVSGLRICGPICAAQEACSATVSQSATVCVPVTITPFATVGAITTQCCGAPVISPGTTACEGAVGQSCTFTVSQELCLNVPVSFGANAETGEASTLCVESALGECNCAAAGTGGVVTDGAAAPVPIGDNA